MSTSDSATTPSRSLGELKAEQYKRFKHVASLTFIIGAPILIALPPRKLDLYTFSLGTAFLLSANQLTVERTNKSILANLNPLQAMRSLPSPRAQEFHERYEMKRQRDLEEIERLHGQDARRREMEKSQGLAEKVWMGGESEGWKERRLREEQEKIVQGEGYGSMIMDQIWEVWNWGKKKEGNMEDSSKKEGDEPS